MILWLLTPVPFSTWDYNRDTSVSLPALKAPGGQLLFHCWALCTWLVFGKHVWDGINQEKPSEGSELCPRSEMSQVGGCWKMLCSQTCTLHFVCKENVALYLLRLISSSPGPPSSTMLCVVVVGWLKTQTCHQRASQSILVWSRFLKVFYLLIPHQATQTACLGDWSRPGSVRGPLGARWPLPWGDLPRLALTSVCVYWHLFHLVFDGVYSWIYPHHCPDCKVLYSPIIALGECPGECCFQKGTEYKGSPFHTGRIKQRQPPSSDPGTGGLAFPSSPRFDPERRWQWGWGHWYLTSFLASLPILLFTLVRKVVCLFFIYDGAALILFSSGSNIHQDPSPQS